MSVTEQSDERVADALRRAAALEADDWRAAIDVLADANRAGPDPALEIALVDLRHRCAARVLAETDPDPDAALGAGVSPPIGPSGLPETDLAGLTAANLRAALLEHGTLVVRGVLSAADAQRLSDEIDECWKVSAGEAEPSDPTQELFRRFWPEASDDANPHTFEQGIRNWIRAAGGVLLCDSPSIQFEVLDLYRRLGLHAVVEEYLGGRPLLSANKCTLRRVSPETVGGWHQDGAFLGTEIRAVNLWLTLTDCGRDAPGMDVVARRLDDLVPTGGPEAYFDWAASDRAVDDAAGPEGIVRPEFRAGDLVIFDELMMHRTATEPTMPNERRAIELWSFSAVAYPEGHIRLVW